MSLLDRYRYRGRHRGEYLYEVLVPRDLGGVHRGRYVEKPEWHWHWTPVFDSIVAGIAWERPAPANAVVDEDRIREIVNDELASTPIYTALRYQDYGRWGDSSIDRADDSSLCISVEAWDDRGGSAICAECELIIAERDSVWGFCSGCVEKLDLEA